MKTNNYRKNQSNIFHKLFIGIALSCILFMTGSIQAQTYITATTGTGNSIPLGGFAGTAGYGIQYLISPGLTTGGFTSMPIPGNITTFYIRMGTTSAGATYTNFTIKLGQTPATTLTTGVWVTAGMSTVYTNPSQVINWVTGTWLPITLTTPFLYDPSQSLIVEITHTGYPTGTSIFPLLNNAVTGSIRRVWASNPPPTPVGSAADVLACGIDVVPAG